MIKNIIDMLDFVKDQKGKGRLTKIALGRHKRPYLINEVSNYIKLR
mgnify:FL=1